ncbi:MAG TPA: hypothetical protein VGP48_00810 [Stellaceae bacterium]|nr:hypothetical protein [Stellaceae bacterium]
MRAHWARRAPKFLAIALVAAALASLVVMLLWNWLAPAVLGLHAINFGEAFGLLVLCRLLFGGWRGHRGGFAHGRWRRRMMERWAQMTPEEREQFARGLRCGPRSARPEQPTAT